jgi:hypothetical protein
MVKNRNTAKLASELSAGTNFCGADHRVIQGQLRIYQSQPVIGVAGKK